MEALLKEQELTIHRLERLMVNYKKRGKEQFSGPTAEERLQRLRGEWANCTRLHLQLELTATAEHRKGKYFTENIYERAEDLYDQATDFFVSVIANAPTSGAKEDSRASGESPSLGRLPRIPLPRFTGVITEWPSFSDKFQALVINDKSLDNVQKLHYLLGTLEGEALSAIKHMAITSANFRSAWKLLRDRYENKRLLVRALVNDLLSLPAVRDNTGGNDLKCLRDRAAEAITSLENIGRPTKQWDDLLVHILVDKLDRSSREEWERSIGPSTEPPTYAEFTTFLNTRTLTLTALEETPCRNAEPSAPKSTPRRPPPRSARVHQTTTNRNSCPRCQAKHELYRCDSFKRLSPSQRREAVREYNCCFKCLRVGHAASNCTSESRCAVCNRAHNTFLHIDGESSGPRVDTVSTHTTTTQMYDTMDEENLQSAVLNCAAEGSRDLKPVILATAVVNIETRDGKLLPVRALLDNGSQLTLASESLVQSLGLPRASASISVSGAGNVPIGRARGRVILVVRWGGPGANKRLTQAFVLPRLTGYQANLTREATELKHLRGLQLADPDPNWKSRIEIIIGTDQIGAFLRPGLRLGPDDHPFAQNTVFGWVILGPDPTANPSSSIHAATLDENYDDELKQQLRRFWELEEASPLGTIHPDDEWCESHFVRTVSRQKDGRYVVRLPLKPEQTLDVGNSRDRALSVLRCVERRFTRDRPLEGAYREFLREYEDLGHMSEIRPPQGNGLMPSRVFLPHHPVVKIDGEGKLKIRVVFNASSRSSTGRSLNDHLLQGPKLQTDICTIITRWRLVRVAIKADIEKMFRQIRVQEDDANLQCVVWRREAESALTEFRLNTVTYGMNCAPFLAQRVLLQLAADEGETYPKAATIFRDNFYVDDVLFGGDCVEEAASSRDELEALLREGGFTLSKWASNTPQLLHPEDHTESSIRLTQGSTCNQPVLGLGWDTHLDAFRFAIYPNPTSLTTKRSILSTIARLYDPLGWAAPVLIVAKILLQDLWLEQYDWDALPAPQIHDRWRNFTASLPHLEKVRVPRWYGVRLVEQETRYELHGFADASSRAYAAVVYLAIRDMISGYSVRISLVAARTKVAPIKTVSIPRLELCAAALLATLMCRTAKELRLPRLETFAWTDSTVVLSWLSRTPSTWNVFVANRVAHVLNTLPDVSWRHVRSADNPADCASRGMNVEDLLAHDLWWKGPVWLCSPCSEWPTRPTNITTCEELRVCSLGASMPDPVSTLDPLPGSVSSWGKLLRVTAIILKVLDRLRPNWSGRTGASDPPSFTYRARIFWLRWLQSSYFCDEIMRIKQGGPVGQKSPLRKLSPFIDREGLIRVGGRLEASSLSYDERHPILLPRHYVTELIVRAVHRITLHGGPQLTLSVLRRTYWVMGARGLVRTIVWRCVTCCRHRALPASQVMAPLPEKRVTPSRPFATTGIDYAGPVKARASKGRGFKSFKSYIAVFVCFATRAVHLELVSDCTAVAFLAALRRFVARRGCPAHVFSDNGTNFRGAARELRDLSRQAVRSPEVTVALEEWEMQWHFSPPAAPHFGGLWEAAVKSVKHHLRRAIGELTLTFEEMSTLLCNVEACLHSRPLSALSSDPDDPAALTPGHFLTGTPLLTLPGEPTPAEISSSRSRWQLVHQATRAFWKRWQQEYLHTLQGKSKWWRPAQSLQIGDLVVLRDANLPPASWRLARIADVHPGPDGKVRVVTLRTASGTLVRPITQIVRLPLSHRDTSSEDPSN